MSTYITLELSGDVDFAARAQPHVDRSIGAVDVTGWHTGFTTIQSSNTTNLRRLAAALTAAADKADQLVNGDYGDPVREALIAGLTGDNPGAVTW